MFYGVEFVKISNFKSEAFLLKKILHVPCTKFCYSNRYKTVHLKGDTWPLACMD